MSALKLYKGSCIPLVCVSFQSDHLVASFISVQYCQDMENITYYTILSFLAMACVLLFILQSYQEMDKYFRRITSIAIKTEAIEDLQYPSILVCLYEPFKSIKYPETVEEFNNLTYSIGEIINLDTLFPSVMDGMEVTEVATYWYGKCYLLQMPQEWSYTKWTGIQMRIGKEIEVHFIENGQESCVINGYCNQYYKSIKFEKDLNVNYEAYIIPRKTILLE